jgi:hypothetical protein
LKVLFIHIAKAAGSSVNKFFLDVFGSDACAVHLESNHEWQAATGAALLSGAKSYLSGHIVYREFRDKLDLNDFFVFTFLRNPVSHVVSHLAWIRKLADSSDVVRFNAHPEYIQCLAIKLAKVDFNSVTDVVALVRGLSAVERALLDNPQVRYLRQSNNGGAVCSVDVNSALNTLAEIDDFGFVESIDVDLARIARSVGHAVAMAPKENALSSKYGLSESNDLLIGALDELIKYDVSLYENACFMRDRRIAADRLKDYSLPDSVLVTIDSVNETFLHGWARYERSSVPVELEIFVNCSFLASITASEYRVDLYERFSKNCAFVYRFEDGFKLSQGDVFTVRVAHTEIKVVNIFSF